MNKLFVFLFFIFSVLNISSILNAQEFPPDKVDFTQKHFNPMEKLNLSDEQKTQFEAFHFKHQREMIEANSKLKKAELNMEEMKSKDGYSRKEVLDEVQKINEVRNKIELLKANHRMDIYEVLTPEQKKVWNESEGKIHRFKEMKNFQGRGDFRPNCKF